MGDRDRWLTRICNPEGSGRFLSPVGGAVKFGSHLPEYDLSDLERFLTKVRDRKDHLRLLANYVDLLSPRYAALIDTLESLLPSISTEADREKVVIGPAFRGVPVWHETMLKQAVGALSPVQYIARLPFRSFDLPENRVLKLLLLQIVHSAERLIAASGTENVNAALRKLRRECRRLLRHPYIKAIPTPARLTSDMKVAANRARHPGYRIALGLLRERIELEAPDRASYWNAVLRVLRAGWLEPVSNDDLFELFSLTFVLDVLGEDCGLGAPDEYGLVVHGREHVARFSADNGQRIYVYFDQSPTVLAGIKSRYQLVASSYPQLGASQRRPDITIVALDPSGQLSGLVFCDAKNSREADYLRESIYKMFGYLYDFHVSAGRGAAILVPQGFRPGTPNLGRDEVILASEGCRELLAIALRKWLGLVGGTTLSP